MQYTTNYQFKKPEPTDTVNVNDFNDSFDLVDQKLKETQDKNTNLQGTFEQLIINAGSSNAEIVASRHDNVTGETHASLPVRLDKVSSELAAIDMKINYVTPEMFGADKTGETDATTAFNNAFSTTLQNGGMLLIPLGHNYLIAGTVTVPPDVSIIGMTEFNDISAKRTGYSDTDLTKPMSTIRIIEDGEFLLGGNNSIKNIAIIYPSQNYNIVSVTKTTEHPDGLSEFVQYNPTFTITGGYIGCVLKDIIYCGGTTILYTSTMANPEKLIVDHIVGYCVGIAFDIAYSTDGLWFSNIMLNCNSLKGFISKNGGSDTNFYTKCSKNTVVFKFHNIDGVQMHDCYAYGIKRFIELVENGTSLAINNCSADVCHEFLYINSYAKPFGMFLNNICVTPIVYKAIVNGVETDRSPCFIRIENSCNDEKISITNARIFGSTISFIADTNKCDYIFWCGTSCQNNRIDLVNVVAVANNLYNDKFETGTNNIDQSAPNTHNLLTATNVLLNGYTKDTNINQYKVIYSSHDLSAEGVQNITGIGFKPSFVTINCCVGLTIMYSDGKTDGTISRCIFNTQSNLKMMSGNEIIASIASASADRCDAKFVGFNNDGLSINWVKVGNGVTGTAGLIITCYR